MSRAPSRRSTITRFTPALVDMGATKQHAITRSHATNGEVSPQDPPPLSKGGRESKGERDEIKRERGDAGFTGTLAFMCTTHCWSSWARSSMCCHVPPCLWCVMCHPVFNVLCATDLHVCHTLLRTCRHGIGVNTGLCQAGGREKNGASRRENAWGR